MENETRRLLQPRWGWKRSGETRAIFFLDPSRVLSNKILLALTKNPLGIQEEYMKKLHKLTTLEGLKN
jgi:hypothetical protein